MKYNHNFNDGDIVTDTEFNEVFVFSNKSDGHRAENSNAFRLATEDEKKMLSESGMDSIELHKEQP